MPTAARGISLTRHWTTCPQLVTVYGTVYSFPMYSWRVMTEEESCRHDEMRLPLEPHAAIEQFPKELGMFRPQAS